ncbi:MAG TPA: hypothetical protein VMT91_08090 [Anaerolineales bacterium]|nr:hypothetical protein [Anaerolineales bacterium]
MPETNVTHRMLSADFVTQSYRVVGKMMVPNTGVVGLINDPTNSFMEIVDAKLARIHMPTKLVGEYKLVDLVKTNVFAICLTRREDVGPQALVRGGYQNLVEYSIRATTQVYELEGTLEWPGRFNFASIMVEGVRDFVPLYKATLTAILIPQFRIESPAILFNRRQVDLIGLVSEKKD